MSEERKDVLIKAPVAVAGARAPLPNREMLAFEKFVFSFDQHNCPFCKQTYLPQAFLDHLPGCVR